MKSSTTMSKFKVGEKSVMSSLHDNNTYLRYNKFSRHSEDSISWLEYVKHIISLQHATREKISDALILVYLNEDEMVVMTNKPSEDTKDPPKKNKLLIPAFDTHHKAAGNGK